MTKRLSPLEWRKKRDATNARLKAEIKEEKRDAAEQATPLQQDDEPDKRPYYLRD